MIKHHAFLLSKQTITIIFLSKNNKRLKAQINEPRVPAYFMLYMTKLPFCPATSSRRRLILLCSAFLSPTPYSSLTSHVIRRLLYFRILNSFVLLIHSWVLLMLLQQGLCPIKNVNAATSSTLFYILLHSCFTAPLTADAFLFTVLLSYAAITPLS